MISYTKFASVASRSRCGASITDRGSSFFLIVFDHHCIFLSAIFYNLHGNDQSNFFLAYPSKFPVMKHVLTFSTVVRRENGVKEITVRKLFFGNAVFFYLFSFLLDISWRLIWNSWKLKYNFILVAVRWTTTIFTLLLNLTSSAVSASISVTYFDEWFRFCWFQKLRIILFQYWFI